MPAAATRTAVAPVAVGPGNGPDVRFGAGRRPEAATQVRVEGFEGPLGLLLSLIEARQLDVLTVPLGALSGAYLEALAGLDADRIGNVSSFVAVAAQLILIKSRAMLPRHAQEHAAVGDDEPDPEAELRARLLLFRAYRDAGTRLQADALRVIGLFRREPGAAQSAALAGARPVDTPTLDPMGLAKALSGLVQLALPIDPPPEVVPRDITLADRAAVIRAAVRNADVIVLQDLLRDVRDRVVVAITFLAMLELMKRREIVVEQAEPWGPIVARRTTPDEQAGRAPLDEDADLDESLASFG
jgi:segregation and condensation protein A